MGDGAGEERTTQHNGGFKFRLTKLDLNQYTTMPSAYAWPVEQLSMAFFGRSRAKTLCSIKSSRADEHMCINARLDRDRPCYHNVL